MAGLLWAPAIAWTAGGFFLLLLPAGICAWWAGVWVVLLAVAAYTGMAGIGGLAAARIAAGASLLLFGAAVFLLRSWLADRMTFAPEVGLAVLGRIPVVIPPLAFAVLAISYRAASCLLPSAGRAVLALTASAGFLLTAWNSLHFLAVNRRWVVLLPAGAAEIIAITTLAGACAFVLAFIFTPDFRMHRSPWSREAVVWLLLNALFLASRLVNL